MDLKIIVNILNWILYYDLFILYLTMYFKKKQTTSKSDFFFRVLNTI